MDGFELVDDAAARRYRLLFDGIEVGFIDVDPVGTDSLLFKHTEVHPQHSGRGYGAELVRGGLERARMQGKSVIPICPYALAFVRQHPEYHELVHADLRSTL
jgi:predicted GNAT family acetyltransferase